MKALCGIIIVFALVVVIRTSPEIQDKLLTAVSQAKGQVTAHRSEIDARLVNGEMDAGISVGVNLTNTGKEGLIQVTEFLTCSEGEWSRTQKLSFRAGESKRLEFFFHEPSINASNIQTRVSVSPGANQD